MDCNERQRLQEEWLNEHDRLCVALEEYERRLAKVTHFDQVRAACDVRRDRLDEHELLHGCADYG